MLVKTNDMHMAIYLSALIRSVIALHDLVNNKIMYGKEDGLTQDQKPASNMEEEKKEDDVVATKGTDEATRK
jgi:26S proteasome regulatory subunit N8